MTPISNESNLPTPRFSSSQGSALAPALMMLLIVTTGAAAFLKTTVAGSERNLDRTDRFEARRSGTSVNRLAAQSVWGGYMRNIGGEEASMTGLRTYLDAQGILDQSQAQTVIQSERIDEIELPKNKAGEYILGTTEILSVHLHRIDLPRETQIVVVTEARERRGFATASTNAVETVTEVFSLEPALWDGLGFALLANNINCIMCHATVDDVRRTFTSAGFADAGIAEGVRAGSLESLQLRENPASQIAGTLFLGGDATNRDGTLIGDWEELSLLGGSYSDEGELNLDLFGDPVFGHLDPANLDASAADQNLYTNYLDGREQVGGPLPDSFPLPFRDDGGTGSANGIAAAGAGNRLVDDAEFAATTSSFQGGISGGAIGVVQIGDEVTTSAEAAQLVAGNEAALGALTRANVVLTGTPDEPIRIEGNVAIDGDLIISGPVHGSGALWVRGNVFVRSDLTYNDVVTENGREFGLNDEGTLNALGLTAGGNIVMGDPYRGRKNRGGTVDGTDAGAWNFTMMEIASFNGREWLKTQAELPGETVNGSTPMHPNPGYRGDDYLARFYTFSEGDLVPIQNKEGFLDPASGQWIIAEHVNGWRMDELTLADVSDPTDATLYPAGRAASVVQPLMPTADWIKEDVMRDLVQNGLKERDADDWFTVDAGLYSANSIFGVVSNQPEFGTNGRLRVHGSILAADLGLLGPRGTEVLYDPRSQALLDIRDESEISLRLLGALPTVRY